MSYTKLPSASVSFKPDSKAASFVGKLPTISPASFLKVNFPTDCLPTPSKVKLTFSNSSILFCKFTLESSNLSISAIPLTLCFSNKVWPDLPANSPSFNLIAILSIVSSFFSCFFSRLAIVFASLFFWFSISFWTWFSLTKVLSSNILLLFLLIINFLALPVPIRSSCTWGISSDTASSLTDSFWEGSKIILLVVFFTWPCLSDAYLFLSCKFLENLAGIAIWKGLPCLTPSTTYWVRLSSANSPSFIAFSKRFSASALFGVFNSDCISSTIFLGLRPGISFNVFLTAFKLLLYLLSENLVALVVLGNLTPTGSLEILWNTACFFTLSKASISSSVSTFCPVILWIRDRTPAEFTSCPLFLAASDISSKLMVGLTLKSGSSLSLAIRSSLTFVSTVCCCSGERNILWSDMSSIVNCLSLGNLPASFLDRTLFNSPNTKGVSSSSLNGLTGDLTNDGTAIVSCSSTTTSVGSYPNWSIGWPVSGSICPSLSWSLVFCNCSCSAFNCSSSASLFAFKRLFSSDSLAACNLSPAPLFCNTPAPAPNVPPTSDPP